MNLNEFQFNGLIKLSFSKYPSNLTSEFTYKPFPFILSQSH
jgi:hypothetical protein